MLLQVQTNEKNIPAGTRQHFDMRRAISSYRKGEIGYKCFQVYTFGRWGQQCILEDLPYNEPDKLVRTETLELQPGTFFWVVVGGPQITSPSAWDSEASIYTCQMTEDPLVGWLKLINTEGAPGWSHGSVQNNISPTASNRAELLNKWATRYLPKGYEDGYVLGHFKVLSSIRHREMAIMKYVYESLCDIRIPTAEKLSVF